LLVKNKISLRMVISNIILITRIQQNHYSVHLCIAYPLRGICCHPQGHRRPQPPVLGMFQDSVDVQGGDILIVESHLHQDVNTRNRPLSMRYYHR
jgi:hypothetical protein